MPLEYPVRPGFQGRRSRRFFLYFLPNNSHEAFSLVHSLQVALASNCELIKGCFHSGASLRRFFLEKLGPFEDVSHDDARYHILKDIRDGIYLLDLFHSMWLRDGMAGRR